jgi:hypothetical protein
VNDDSEMETATLFTLPAQPLPSMDKRDNIFMTIWLVLCLVLGYYIQREVLRPNSTATEFRTICIGIWLLVTSVSLAFGRTHKAIILSVY